MQSFKQYILKEQTRPFAFPYLVLELENKEGFAEATGISGHRSYVNAFDNEVDSFVNGLKSHLGVKEIDWSFNSDDNLQVDIKLNNRHYVQDELEEIASEAMRYTNEELSSSFSSLEDINPAVYFFDNVDANVIIDYPVIGFDLRHVKAISLSNFDKHFPNTQTIKFESAKNKVSNILSLLNIKSLRSVIARSEPWADILNKFIKTHDVIGCQEELIDAGFKDMAEL